jgi:hypothetical protein
MKRFLKQMAIFVLPVWLFDGCANRDPGYYLDDTSSLGAPWSTAPLTFEFRDRENPDSDWYQLHDVTDFLMNDSLFTGRTAEEYFIVHRPEGDKYFFRTQGERDAALKRDFSTSVGELRQKPWYSGIRANVFFPWNLLYYVVVTGIIAFVCVLGRRTQPTPNKRMESNG